MADAPKQNLPIDRYLPEISELVLNNRISVIQADPGSGKTTRIPPALAQVIKKRTYVLEPRRIAAKLSAERVSQENQTPLSGEFVGYHVRFEKRYTKDTKLVFATEGILARLLSDPEFCASVGCLIFDEFHERNLNTDLALSMALNLTEKFPDLRIVLLSATLARAQIEKLLPQTPFLKIDAPIHPCEVVYHEVSENSSQLVQNTLQILTRALAAKKDDGSVLVFLPGRGEIEGLRRRLSEDVLKSYTVCTLYSEAPEQEIRLAFDGRKRKIILSTNIAESSVTVDGVNCVVDCGFSRQSGFAYWNSSPTLEVKKISQASAIQRAGRAARQGPGVVHRCYPIQSFYARPEFTTPEICRADLCSPILNILQFCQKHKISYSSFKWVENPPESLVQAASTSLSGIGAVDCDNFRLTKLGEDISSFAMHPRHALIWLVANNSLPAAILAAGLESDDASFSKAEILESLEETSKNCGRGLAYTTSKIIDQITGSKKISTNFVRAELVKALILAFGDRAARFVKKEQLSSGEFKIYYQMQQGGQAILQTQHASFEYILVLKAREITGGSSDKSRTISIDCFVGLRKDEAVSCANLFENNNAKKQEQDKSLLLVKNNFKDLKDSDFLNCYRNQIQLLQKHGEAWDLPEFDEEMLQVIASELLDTVESKADLAATSLRDLILGYLRQDQIRHLQKHAPLNITLSNGQSFAIKYEDGREPIIIAPIQLFYGVANDPVIVGGKQKLVIEFLGPNKLPVQRTMSLSGFWKNHFPVLRAEFKREYPRHYWPEDPLSAKPVILARHV